MLGSAGFEFEKIASSVNSNFSEDVIGHIILGSMKLRNDTAVLAAFILDTLGKIRLEELNGSPVVSKEMLIQSITSLASVGKWKIENVPALKTIPFLNEYLSKVQYISDFIVNTASTGQSIWAEAERKKEAKRRR